MRWSRKEDRTGIKVHGLSYDYAQVIKRSREVAERLAKGVEFLLRKNRIPLLAGAGRLEGKNRVIIETSGQGAQQVEADRILIATGSGERTLRAWRSMGNRFSPAVKR